MVIARLLSRTPQLMSMSSCLLLCQNLSLEGMLMTPAKSVRMWKSLCSSPIARAAMYVLPIGALLVFLVRWSTYWVNDDSGYVLVLSGAFTGSPDARVPFLGPPLSLMLAGLYSVSDNVPWYPLFLVAIPAVAAGTVMYRYRFCGAGQKALFAIPALMAIAFLLFSPNYTFSSFVASALVCLTVDDDNYWSRSRYVGTSILFTLAMSLRIEATPIALVPLPALYSVGLFTLVAMLNLRRVVIARLLLTLVMSLSLLQAFSWLQLRGDSDYREYLQFNVARAQVNDAAYVSEYLRSTEYLNYATSINLDQFSLSLLDSFESFEADIATTDKIMTLVSRAGDKASSVVSFRDLLLFGEETLQLAVVLLAAVVGAVVAFQLKTKAVMKLAAVSASAVLATHLVSVYVKMNGPVRQGIFVVGLLAIAGVVGPLVKQVDTSYRRKVIGFVILGSVVVADFGSLVHSRLSAIQTSRQAAVGALQLIEEAKDYVDVGWSSSRIVVEALQQHPWNTDAIEAVRSSRLVWGGTLLRSPMWADRWRRLTDSAEPDSEIFKSSLIERVALPPERANELAAGYWNFRNKCFVITPALTPNWVNLKPAETNECSRSGQ
jgi:hypothetical protein